MIILELTLALPRCNKVCEFMTSPFDKMEIGFHIFHEEDDYYTVQHFIISMHI